MDVVGEIRRELRRAAAPARAPGQQAYMKSALPFLGVRVPEARRISLLMIVIISADFGSNGITRRYGELEIGMAGHFWEVGAFATEQVFHGFITVGFSAAEAVNVLLFIC